MLLLISDANILIDLDVGDLLASMFSMEYRFAVPDVRMWNTLAGDGDGPHREDFNDDGAGRVSAYA